MWKFVLILCVASVSASYSGIQILEIHPQNEDHITLLQKMAQDSSIDILSASPKQYTVMVSPQSSRNVSSSLKAMACKFTLSDINVEKEVKEESKRLSMRSESFNYNDFNDLETINVELDRLAQKCVPGFVCSVDSIGDSIENREIRRLKISKTGAQRKAVWIDATTHAREWLTTSSLMMMIRELIENYDTNKDAKHLMDTYDFYLLPVMNPDGYIYSWSTDRLWRKNMRVNPGTNCIGVDLNRNAGYLWNNGGSSGNPCAQTYHGSKPASEPETVAVQNALIEFGSSIINYITMHAYGQYWLIPFGTIDPETNQCVVSKEDPEMLRVANDAADAIEKEYHTKWQRGGSCAIMYPASGEVLDFAKAIAGVKYGAVPEVRGPFFVVPPASILPSFHEMWAGLVASTNAIELGARWRNM